MPLVINQGKQDTTQDNKFNPIKAKGVLAQITEIKLADSNKMPDTLEITFRIIAGEHKNRFFWDRVTYAADSNFSWKYRSLRKAAGVPYSKDEPKNIDIEKLLLNKAVTVDLGIRKGKNRDGIEQEYQNVIYKVVKGVVETNEKVDADEVDATDLDIEDFVEEDTVDEKPKAKAKAKPKAKPKAEPKPEPEASVEEEEEETSDIGVEAIDVSDDDDWAD